MKALETFQLEEAIHYRCKIEAYTSTHSMLLVRIDFEGYVGYILFSFVQFFNGPKWWQGLDFQIASPQMTLDFMRRHSGFDYIKDREILDHYKLFHIERPRLQVQIVAEKVAQSEARPKYAYRDIITE